MPGDLLARGRELMRQWAASSRGMGTGIGYPSQSPFVRLQKPDGAWLSGDPDVSLLSDPEWEQVEEALLWLLTNAPHLGACLRAVYLPRDQLPMEAVGRVLKVSRKTASHWHETGLAFVVGRVDG